MSLKDLNGVALSTAHPLAREAWNRASMLFHGYYGDPLAAIDEALQAHPDFAMGHVLKAGVVLTTTDVRLYPLAAEALASARRHAGPRDVRAQGHLAAAGAWLEGDLQRAVDLYGAVLAAFPRDAFALQLAHLGDYLLGDANALRERPATTLAHWDRDAPAYGYMLGMHAFGLEESGDFERAEAVGREALERNRRDPWAIHAVAHVFEMQGRLDEGIDWLERRRDDWVPDNGFAFHNAWHLALYWLELDQHDKVLSLYDELVRPAANDVVYELIDASALLWRLHLRGVDVGRRWQDVSAQWRGRVGDRLNVFNDLHALLALLACGELAGARALLADLEASPRGSGRHAAPAWHAAIDVARGLLAFAERRDAEALPHLMRGHERAVAFGGSAAQRDLVALTALECARRADAAGIALDLVQRRLDLRPNSPFAWAALAEWRARHADETTARNARNQATQSRREWLRRIADRSPMAA